MHDLNSRRILRCLICLVLICALLVNVSPIRAKAVLIELTTAELVRLGFVALASLMVCGIYYNVQHQSQLESLGRSFHSQLLEAQQTEDDVEILDVWLGSIWVSDLVVNWRSTKDAGSGFINLALLTILENLFSSAPDPILYVDPESVYSVAPVGQAMQHTFLTTAGGKYYYNFTVLAATAPVYYFSLCTKRTHYIGFCSSEVFNVNSSVMGDQSAKYYRTSNGGFYMYAAEHGFDVRDLGPQCFPSDVTPTIDLMTQIGAGLVANGLPQSELYPSGYEGDLQDHFNSGNVQTLDIPDIDLSQTTQDELIEMANKVISGEMTHQEVLDRLTGGQTIVVNPSIPEVDTGTDTDPSESTEPTKPIDPGPGTGTDPDIGTGTDPDPNPDPEPDPDPDPNPDPNPDPDPGGSGTGTGTGTGTGSGSWNPPKTPMSVDLTQFFPFCIPFDLFEFFKLLHAEPVAPVLYWEMADLAGQTYSISIDLSEWDSVAQLFRRLQLFLFICGLAVASRKFIKW